MRDAFGGNVIDLSELLRREVDQGCAAAGFDRHRLPKVPPGSTGLAMLAGLERDTLLVAQALGSAPRATDAEIWQAAAICFISRLAAAIARVRDQLETEGVAEHEN